MVTPYAEMWQDTTQVTQVGLSFVPVFVHRFEVWTLLNKYLLFDHDFGGFH